MQNYDSIGRNLASIFKFGPRTGTGHERDIVGAYSTFHSTNSNKYLKTHVHSVKFWNIVFQFRMRKTFLAWKSNKKKKTSLEQIFYNSRTWCKIEVHRVSKNAVFFPRTRKEKIAFEMSQ